jgi:hypothetical protein
MYYIFRDGKIFDIQVDWFDSKFDPSYNTHINKQTWS